MVRWMPRIAIMAAVATMGCDPDTAVFVDASIENANLAMTMSSLSTGVSGSFDLRLHLGPRAADASEVDLVAFSIDSGVTLVDVVGATTSPAFPVTVGVDSDVVVTFTLAADDNLIENANVDALCQLSGVTISGAISDSLRGANVDVSSNPVAVSDCP